jgi:excinuclease UvrABC helicase subunit UvrB
LFAKRVTGSMQRCMDITNQQRQAQLAYNAQHGHEPKSTRGSSVLTFFDLLKDQIEAEQNLEIVPSNNNKKREKALDLPMT